MSCFLTCDNLCGCRGHHFYSFLFPIFVLYGAFPSRVAGWKCLFLIKILHFTRPSSRHNLTSLIWLQLPLIWHYSVSLMIGYHKLFPESNNLLGCFSPIVPNNPIPCPPVLSCPTWHAASESVWVRVWFLIESRSDGALPAKTAMRHFSMSEEQYSTIR